MSTFVGDVVTYLKADPTLMAYLPGGVYDFAVSGRKGVNRQQLPDAYDTQTGLIKRFAFLLELDDDPTGEAVGAVMSRRTPLLVWVFDHGDNGYATIEAAVNRIRKLLHLHQFPGSCQAYWVRTYKDKREPLLNDAGYYRTDFSILSLVS